MGNLVTAGEIIRIRIALAAAVLALVGLTGCDKVNEIVNVNPANTSSPVSINNAEALKAALAMAGIDRDVHVVNTTDGSIAVWASVPGLENCPIRWVATPEGTYKADKLHKTDGSQADLNSLQAQPTAVDIGIFALQNGNIFTGCKGANNKPNPMPTN